MQTTAVVFQEPESVRLSRLEIVPPGEDDVLVEIAWSGISTGTEKLLWSGRMPPFPGMGYPLVPGYESVGRIVYAGSGSGRREGETVFVPGARCYGEVRGLFGGASARVVLPGARVAPVEESLGEKGVLLALAATARHAIADGSMPELVVGHGILGRLIARIAIAEGGAPPVVWERNRGRMAGAFGYPVVDPADDPRTNYRAIYDASGDSGLLDTLIGRLAPRGEVVLAGFYAEPLSFRFPPAFMREARLRVAAEWKPADLAAVSELVATGRLSLDGLISEIRPAAEAASAYQTAFDDPTCLKMILDWRGRQ
jgi:3-hydroxyethyl bacteriochlorophyllide a dehydrogenase